LKAAQFIFQPQGHCGSTLEKRKERTMVENRGRAIVGTWKGGEANILDVMCDRRVNEYGYKLATTT